MWTQESTCHLIETNIRDQEELEGKRVPQYPCLWVNVSSVGRWAVLYHTEDTRDQNHQVLTGWVLGLPWWLSGKESACQCRRCEFDPWVGKIPWCSIFLVLV